MSLTSGDTDTLSMMLWAQKRYKNLFKVAEKKLNYRVSGLSCPEAGGCKSAILRGFPIEEWEGKSQITYYPVDHAMTAHMTSP